jgi:nicotinamidase-related amidase
MTHPNLLDSGNSVLVVVDMQSRLTQVMPEQEAAAMATNSIRLLEAAKILDVPVLLTEQYPKGLGPTVAEILEHLPQTARVFDKTGFSCCAAEGFNQALATSGRAQVILVGQEAHVCVLQTALELLHHGYRVYAVEDAICSRKVEHKFNALRRMRQHGATIVCYESVLFEWLKDARHADFKTISSLLR